MTVRKSLKNSIRDYISTNIELNELENVILNKMRRYYRESETEMNNMFESRFRTTFNKIETLRGYYLENIDCGESLLDNLTERGDELLSRKYSSFYNKILN